MCKTTMHHCAPCSATTVHSTGAHFSSPQINGFTRFRNNSQFVCFSCGTPPSPEQVPPSKPEIKAMGKIISSGSSRTIGFPKMLKPFVGGGRGRVIHPTPPPPSPPGGAPPHEANTENSYYNLSNPLEPSFRNKHVCHFQQLM